MNIKDFQPICDAPRDGTKFVAAIIEDGVIVDIGITWFWDVNIRRLGIKKGSLTGGPASKATHWFPTKVDR